MNTFVRNRILLSVYILVTLGLCFVRSEYIPTTCSQIGTEIADGIGIPGDKIVHSLLFFPFPPLTMRAIGYAGRKYPYRLWGGIMLAGILLGGAIEWLQGLSGYRSCDIGDFWADCIGILLGGGLVLHRKRIKSKIGFVK